MKKILSFMLALLMLALPVSQMASCSPPPLEEVYDRLVWLIENSRPVNEIVYGDGLVSMQDLSGEELEYDSWFEGLDKYAYYYEIPASYRDEDGNLIEQFSSIAQIKEAVEKVYSDKYVEEIYDYIFTDDFAGGKRAKYLEIDYGKDEDSDETLSGGEEIKKTFCKYHGNTKNYITSEKPHTVYKYDTMKIIDPSTDTYIVISIQGYNENYLDPSTGEITTGWHEVQLRFVKEHGEWFLDSPSY